MTSQIIVNDINAVKKLLGISRKEIKVIAKAFDANQNIVFQSGDAFSYTATEPLFVDTRILLYKQDVLGFNGIYIVSSNPSGLNYILTREIKSTDLKNYYVNIDNTIYSILQDKDVSGITFEIVPFDDYEDVVREVKRLSEDKANIDDVNTSLALKEDIANKDIANGYAGLDSSSQIDINQVLPSRFITAGTNITIDEDPTTKVLTINSAGGGGGGGGGSGGINGVDFFRFRERLVNINWTLNSGSNTLFNFTDEIFTQTVVDEDYNFLKGSNPYFIYDSATQSLKFNSNITDTSIEFDLNFIVNYNGNSGAEFAIILGKPSASTNQSTNIIQSAKNTQGQNPQSTQVRSLVLSMKHRLLPTATGNDSLQTDGFKVFFANYSNTSLTMTEITVIITLAQKIKNM